MDRSSIDRFTIESQRNGTIQEEAGCVKGTQRRRSVVPLASRSKRKAPLRYSPPRPQLRQVTFEFFDSQAASVSVAGTFTNWNPQACALRNADAGEWCLQTLLAPGRYEYRFLVDGQWRMDPTARHQVTDFCGGMNSVLAVE